VIGELVLHYFSLWNFVCAKLPLLEDKQGVKFGRV